MKKSISLVSIAACMLFFSSCRKELEGPSWETNILAPLLKSKLNINDLVTDTLLVANADSSLKIVYNTSFVNLPLDSILVIPDTSILYAFAPFFNYTISPNEQLVNINDLTKYDFGSAELITVKLNSGFLDIYVKNESKDDIVVVYNIPSLKLNSIPLSLTFTVPDDTLGVPGIYNNSIPLNGYVIDLTGPSGTKYNTVQSLITATVASYGQSTTMTPQDSLVIKNTFRLMKPGYAKGYFGSDDIFIGPSTENFDLFNKVTAGSLQLEKLDLKLNISNGLGVDARVTINNINSKNTNTNTTVNLSSSIINTPINITRAAETGNINNPVIPFNKTILLNNSNSNIKALFENLPHQIGYKMKVTTNPLGNVSGSNDFLYSTHGFSADMNIEMPLSLVATGLTLENTAAMDLSAAKEKGNVKEGTFTLYANNGFPFDATVQLYLLDDNNNKVDSLFSAINTVDEGVVNPTSLKVTAPRLTKLSIPVSERKMQVLLGCKKLLIKARFDTSENPKYVKIYSHYSIDFSLTGDFIYKVVLK